MPATRRPQRSACHCRLHIRRLHHSCADPRVPTPQADCHQAETCCACRSRCVQPRGRGSTRGFRGWRRYRPPKSSRRPPERGTRVWNSRGAGGSPATGGPRHCRDPAASQSTSATSLWKVSVRVRNHPSSAVRPPITTSQLLSPARREEKGGKGYTSSRQPPCTTATCLLLRSLPGGSPVESVRRNCMFETHRV